MRIFRHHADYGRSSLIPYRIRDPFILFILAAIIGYSLQSLNANRLVPIESFVNGLFTWLDATQKALAVAFILGFSPFISIILMGFYYAIMLVSVFIISYRLLLSLNQRSSQKFILLILALGALLFIAQRVNFSIEDNACSSSIVPQTLRLGIVEYNETFAHQLNGLYISPIPPFFLASDVIASAGFGSYKPTWKDGQPILDSATGNDKITPICSKGSSEGQNANYYYCRPLLYSKTTQDISSEGVIGPAITTSYDISLVLKEIDGNRAKFDDRICQSGCIVDTLSEFSIVQSKCIKKNP